MKKKKLKPLSRMMRKFGGCRRVHASGDQESPFLADRNIIFKGK